MRDQFKGRPKRGERPGKWEPKQGGMRKRCRRPVKVGAEAGWEAEARWETEVGWEAS